MQLIYQYFKVTDNIYNTSHQKRAKQILFPEPTQNLYTAETSKTTPSAEINNTDIILQKHS